MDANGLVRWNFKFHTYDNLVSEDLIGGVSNMAPKAWYYLTIVGDFNNNKIRVFLNTYKRKT